MDAEAHPLHILFFPFLAPGHMNPMVDMAKLFARQGVKATILTTSGNAPLIQHAIDRANELSDHHLQHPISIHTLPFLGTEAGLPPGCENFLALPSIDLLSNFFSAVSLLRKPFHQILTDLAPDAVVTDMYLPWTYDVAAEHGVPRLVFHGMSFFYFCASDSLERHKPLERLTPDAKTFVLPDLPHRIEMLRTHIPDYTKSDNHSAFVELAIQQRISEARSYGVVVNSFYELEPDYAEHYQKVIGRRAWHVGPVSLCNQDKVDMLRRGNAAATVGDACLKWLDSKAPGSVVYVCLGSLTDFNDAQMGEIAHGLEASNHPFIWAMKNRSHDWVPEGYEERNKERGMLIRGMAPQVLILNHPAVGGFLTHCGWNSCLEGMSAGVPLATCPLFADQFYNERMAVDVLGIGVCIGVKKYLTWTEKEEKEMVVVVAEQIEKAVNELMGTGEEAESRRRRVRLLQEKALTAVEEGGSSYVDIGNLIEELKGKRLSESGKP